MKCRWPTVALVMYAYCACWTVEAQMPRDAHSFQIEFGYFDIHSGPLTATPLVHLPLQDGAVVQVIVDADRNGIALPREDGSPGEDDRLLDEVCQSKYAGSGVSFLLNSEAKLGVSGYFLSQTYLGEDSRKIGPVHLRIWNSASLRHATAYWESPRCELAGGPQQLSFTRDELSYHSVVTATTPDPRAPRHRRPAPDSTQHNFPEISRLTAYPNPFNSSTTISFSTSEAASVQVLVYDLQGRLVNTLADEYMSPGNHTMNFAAENLPSGMYLIALRQGNRTRELSRVMLLK